MSLPDPTPLNPDDTEEPVSGLPETAATSTEPPLDPALPVRPSIVAILWKWLRRALLVVGSIPILAALGVGLWLSPWLLDDWRLDRIVDAVVLDWRDFGLDKAKARLQYELDHQDIGMQIGDDSCSFQAASGMKVVRCGWSVQVVLPFANRPVPLSFESESMIDGNGELR